MDGCCSYTSTHLPEAYMKQEEWNAQSNHRWNVREWLQQSVSVRRGRISADVIAPAGLQAVDGGDEQLDQTRKTPCLWRVFTKQQSWSKVIIHADRYRGPTFPFLKWHCTDCTGLWPFKCVCCVLQYVCITVLSPDSSHNLCYSRWELEDS